MPIELTPGGATMVSPNRGSAMDLKSKTIACLNKLADRDTFAMASTELESMARKLPPEYLGSFLACIHDTDSSHRSPVRRQCVRLLSTLARSHANLLSPLLPKIVHAVLRRLRDSDSAVRSACVDAVSAAASCVTYPSFSSAFLKPLSDAILIDQDINLHQGASLCLAAAVDAAPEVDPEQLQRVLPRFMKLLKSEGFKAKPALVSAIGSMVSAGGARNENLLKALVPCLVELLSSDDWSARKAATEALLKVGMTERELIGEFKDGCLSTFEARRFDKVKAVRDLMSQMIDAWKQVPGISSVDASVPDKSQFSQKGDVIASRASGTINSNSTLKGRRKFSLNKSSPTVQYSASPTNAQIRSSSNGDKQCTSPSLAKLDHKMPSDWKIEIAPCDFSPIPHICNDRAQNEKGSATSNQETKTNNAQSRLEVKRALFGKNRDEKMQKFSMARLQSRVVPIHDMNSLEICSSVVEEFYDIPRDDGNLSVIRNKLVHIENQQSSLLDLLQKFIGTSQKGMQSLESRVHGIEMALDDISYDLSLPNSRVTDADTAKNTCCRLPGTEFLSSKFWRMDGGRYSNSRLSSSDMSPFFGGYWLEKGRTKSPVVLPVNPLADMHSQLRSDIFSSVTSMAVTNPKVAEYQWIDKQRAQEISAPS